MKEVIALALLMCGTGLVAQVQIPPAQAEADLRAEQEVRRLNAAECEAFLRADPKALANLWSDDFVVTNPLNKFVTKPQPLGMVQSGFLVITSMDRKIEYVRVYGDNIVIPRR